MKTLTTILLIAISLSASGQTVKITNSTISGFSNQLVVKGKQQELGKNNSVFFQSRPETIAKLRNDTLLVYSNSLDQLQKLFSEKSESTTIFFKVLIYKDGRKIVRASGERGRIIFKNNSVLIEDQ